MVNIAPDGLTYTPPDDAEGEAAELAAQTERYKPLIEWLRKEVREKGAARDGMFSLFPACPCPGITASDVVCVHSRHFKPPRHQLMRYRRRRVWLHRQPREADQYVIVVPYASRCWKTPI